MPAQRIDSLVIGAGHAGLGVSRELARRGVEHLVLEQARIGETWRSQRWDAFALNTPGWMNRLPDDAGPVDGDDFSSAGRFALDLERYAFRHRLPVRQGVAVRSVAGGSSEDRLAVLTGEGRFEA